ncbi:cleavage and polyadenylation specificity factor, partial [Hamiltosporidium magnivora]
VDISNVDISNGDIDISILDSNINNTNNSILDSNRDIDSNRDSNINTNTSNTNINNTNSNTNTNTPPTPNNNNTTPTNNTLPLTYSYSLDLYRCNTLIDSYKLQLNEYICMVKYMLLNNTQEVLPYIIICTSYIKGEDNICKGRLIILKIKSVIPQINKPLTTLRLGVIAIENTKGPVICCDVLRYKIVVCIGTKVFVYEVSPIEGVSAIAFHDMHVMCSSVCCFKNYVVVGDVCRGVSMFYYQSRPVKMYLLGVSEALGVMGVIYVMRIGMLGGVNNRVLGGSSRVGLEGVSKEYGYKGVSRNMLEGVSNKEYDYKGVSSKEYNYRGVSNSTSKQHPLNISTYEQQGVNNLSFKQQGVSKSIDKQHPLNISTNEQHPVNNLSFKQQGVNNSTNEQQGVNNLSNEQHPVNNLSNKQHPLNISTYEQQGVNYLSNKQQGVSKSIDKQHPLNTNTTHNKQHPPPTNNTTTNTTTKYDNEVGMVCFDDSTLYCYTYSPYNLLSKNGTFLIKRSEITINEEIRVSGSGNIGVLFTNDSFIKITVLNEKFYNILNGLCSNVKGGVNYRNISITKNVLRGMCVKGGCFYEGVIEFLRFGYFKQKDVCREIGVEWEEVMSII